MVVNGQYIALSDLKDDSLEALMEYLSLLSNRVAVEINGNILAQGEYKQIALHEQDKIEIIYFVGGG